MRSRRSRAPLARFLLPTLALIGSARPLRAQSADEGTKSIQLQIRPRVGDVLRMRLDQRVEMSGTTRVRGADSTSSVSSTLLVFTRATVEDRDPLGTTVLATTDSVSLWTNGPDSSTAALDARRALLGRRVRLHVAPDGSTEVVGGGEGLGPELHSLFAQMPATLPRDEVTVGRSWTRVMVLPLAGGAASSSATTIKATFRFDSLSASGELAYLSMRGTLAQSQSQGAARGGTVSAMSGAVDGSLIVDRKRGWITDARLTFNIRSLLSLPSAVSARPMRFRMKVSQWMRVVP